jgi:riboflavin transporter FmnP
MKKELSRDEIKQLRLFAGALFALVTIVTAIKYLLRGYPKGTPLGLILVAIAGAVFLIALVAPKPLGPAFRCWMVIARVIGWFNARLLLSILFYLVFTPIGLIMRLIGRDALRRDFNSSKGSFWIAKEEPKDGLERYTRQF